MNAETMTIIYAVPKIQLQKQTNSLTCLPFFFH